MAWVGSTLVLQQRGGLLHILAKASYEIGYQEGVQLSSSIAIAPGSAGARAATRSNRS